MTRALGYQKEVFNIQEVLAYFRASNYEDCRINAYPSFTRYEGINRTAPTFLMIDIDLKDFASKDKLDGALKRVVKKIETGMRGHPTVLWAGNGYHIYQPMAGFILEETDIFAKFIDQNRKDLTSKFMQFAEDFLTNKKGDPQHNPTINSCLVRVPGTIKSKCGQVIRIVQSSQSYSRPINCMSRVCSSSSPAPVVCTSDTISSSSPAARSSASRAATIDSFPEITKLSTRVSGTAWSDVNEKPALENMAA
jgi:hypothetical protein